MPDSGRHGQLQVTEVQKATTGRRLCPISSSQPPPSLPNSPSSTLDKDFELIAAVTGQATEGLVVAEPA